MFYIFLTIIVICTINVVTTPIDELEHSKSLQVLSIVFLIGTCLLWNVFGWYRALKFVGACIGAIVVTYLVAQPRD